MSDNNFINMNPLYGIYKEFNKIIKTIVIKYNYLAEKNETFESKRNADAYIAALMERDNFLTYRDYTVDEFLDIGLTDASLISIYSVGDGYLQVPDRYRDLLLKNRRAKIIRDYNEKNEYYRMLNGLPPLSTKSSEFHYVPEYYAKKYGIDKSIPIHKIQDYYNNIESGKGDYLIKNIEGVGVINTLKSNFPEEEYLNYIGSKRISIKHAREAKNFQILYVSQTTVKNSLYDEFLFIYEQCRDYFVSAIFVRQFRDFIPYYDQFIALCIMVMTINTTLNKQFPLGIDREYYNNFTLKMLYEAYGIPYNMKIDEYTQKRIAQSLNLLIQKKATDKVIFNIAEILGYENIGVYKYYLGKERKFDIYGVPIIKYTEKFNTDTGEYETVPDYEAMYDLYFQKVELRETDFIKSFYDKSNKEDYEKITSGDPFWWEDSDLYNQVWETEYNFVESKYLSLAISYNMTDIMYENILLLKMLIDKKDPLSSIKFTLPKICPDLEITMFDAVLLLFCLTSKKHHLKGEIIAIPTQVLSVLDYLHNTDGGDEYLVDSFGFDFKLFLPENLEGQALLDKLKFLLGEEDPDAPEKLMSYISQLSINDDLPNTEKIRLINEIYTNVKGLSKYLQYKMSETHDRETYETLKEFYYAAFYAKEVKDIYTINEGDEETKRTAKNFFEFLYYYNPKLYSSIFTPNFEEQYENYIVETGLNPDVYTMDNYKHDIDMGTVDFSYSSLNFDNTEITVTEELIYYYIDHIIFRMEEYIKDLKFIYMINDSVSPLEDLLVRMIRFFKSFTVDLLGFDTIYITDMKAENLMRFFDEVARIKKEIEVHEDIHLSYADMCYLIANYNLEDKTLQLTDKALYNKFLLINERYNEELNSLYLHDHMFYTSILMYATTHDTSHLDLVDYANIVSTHTLLDKKKDQPLFRDHVAKMWYSE